MTSLEDLEDGEIRQEPGEEPPPLTMTAGPILSKKQQKKLAKQGKTEERNRNGFFDVYGGENVRLDMHGRDFAQSPYTPPTHTGPCKH